MQPLETQPMGVHLARNFESADVHQRTITCSRPINVHLDLSLTAEVFLAVRLFDGTYSSTNRRPNDGIWAPRSALVDKRRIQEFDAL